MLIADDHAVLREALAALIGAQPDMTVVAEARNGSEVVEKALSVDPHVMVVDISMPVISGTQAIQLVRLSRPLTKALVLSMYDEPSFVEAVVAAGAAGYVAKHAGGRELLDAIRAVQAGRTPICLAVGEDAPALAHETPGRPAPKELLTKREREVLQLVAEGFTNSQIGLKLGVSKKSVDTYRMRLASKLGLRDRADLVRYALEVGALRPASR